MFKMSNYNRPSKWQQLQDAAESIGMKLGRELTSKQLEAGMKVAAYYNSTNEGVDVVEVLGFTGHDKKYGKGGIKFQTASELYKAYGVKNLKQLEEAFNDRAQYEYGNHPYLFVRALDHEGLGEDRGPWYYPFEGRWARGSGAEKLSFVELITAEEDAHRKAELQETAELKAKQIKADRIRAEIARLQVELKGLEA